MVTNCVLWGDSSDEISNEESASATVTYSDIQGGYDGEGNIDADPLFADPGSGDYHLLRDSPCIDAGNNDAPNLPGFDFEGDPRVMDGNRDGMAVADMGVDEVYGYALYLPLVHKSPSVALRVGMVSDVAGMDDNGFNANTWAGLQRAQAELGVQVQFIESQSSAEYEANIAEFAEQGYDLVVTVGFLMGDATANMAAEYPNTRMTIMDYAYDPPIPNVAATVFSVDEAAFPAGYLAAGWAVLQDPADPQVGWVGGMQIPPVEQFIVAYDAGVHYYNTTTARTCWSRVCTSATLTHGTRALSRATR